MRCYVKDYLDRRVIDALDNHLDRRTLMTELSECSRCWSVIRNKVLRER